MDPTCAILAIGTELTIGQILNRNAAWLSESLTTLGIRVSRHEVVPDDRGLILESLNRLGRSHEVLFVTGGLGPTSDDFTREVVAEWAQQAISYNENAWSKIERRFRDLGIKLTLNNKSQCYFPEKSIRIVNEAGSADGFLLTDPCLTYVIPGPPNEGKHLWDSFILDDLRSRFPNLNPPKRISYLFLGIGESLLAEQVDVLLGGLNIEIGYRASPPYVEVKIVLKPQNDLVEIQTKLAELEQRFRPLIASKNNEDVATIFLCRLAHERSSSDLIVIDRSAGTLSSRLRTTLYERLLQFVSQEDFASILSRLYLYQLPTEQRSEILKLTSSENPHATRETILSFLSPHCMRSPDSIVFYTDEEGCVALLDLKDGRFVSEKLTSPYHSPALRTRQTLYFVEKSMLFWNQNL